MRGTVSTYDLNVDVVTLMLDGKLMLCPLTILSSLISVMYIGVRKLPKNWLRSTFRVHRGVVGSALAWLKTNNPKYYGDITISADTLNRLLDDDVPDEILSIVQQSDDVGILDQEGAGYVRTDDIGILFISPLTWWLLTMQFSSGCGRWRTRYILCKYRVRWSSWQGQPH